MDLADAALWAPAPGAFMAQLERLSIPVNSRSEATLTISRGGELYGSILNLYVRVKAAGNIFRVLDQQGNALVEFVQPTVVRTIPAAELRRAPVVAIDVFVTLKQPSQLTGSVQVQARLETAGAVPSNVSDSLQLEVGDETGVLDVGWEISG